MPEHDDERRKRSLTDADLDALMTRLAELHVCTFDEETRVAVRALAKADPNILVKIADAYQGATNYLWKGILALAVVAIVVLALFGAGIKFPRLQ